MTREDYERALERWKSEVLDNNGKIFADYEFDETIRRALQMAIDYAPDCRKDGLGIDDGPPLTRGQIADWKRPLVKRAFSEGLSARACARVFDVSHDTAARWTRNITPPKGGKE